MPLFGKDITVGLEMSGQILRAVCVEHRQDRPRLLALERQQLSGSSRDVSGAGGDIGRVLKYGRKTRRVVVNIPGSIVQLKKIQVEASEIDDLHDWVRWEAQQFLSGPLEEYFIDFQQLGSRESGLLDILLVVARAEDVLDRARLLRSAQVKPSIMDADPLALQNAFEANYPGTHDLPVILVNVEEALTTLVATRDGIPEGTVSLPTTGEIQSFDHEVYTTLTRLAGRICHQQESEQHLCGVLLSGSEPHLQEMANFLSSREELKVELADPFRELAIVPELRNRLERDYRAPEFMLATGLALRRT
jgi:Tfp pilus assembly PilM family ATPase